MIDNRPPKLPKQFKSLAPQTPRLVSKSLNVAPSVTQAPSWADWRKTENQPITRSEVDRINTLLRYETVRPQTSKPVMDAVPWPTFSGALGQVASQVAWSVIDKLAPGKPLAPTGLPLPPASPFENPLAKMAMRTSNLVTTLGMVAKLSGSNPSPAAISLMQSHGATPASRNEQLRRAESAPYPWLRPSYYTNPTPPTPQTPPRRRPIYRRW